ncbi:dihydrofolate reductase family protein [Jatrophihabitans sp.]|uniref:dihydrofolate reductase family protein n=1 Tax=Jatrophihabitans sp. TaxID=1932789 RepID=UPI0030C74426|nr:Pyrimidine reductase riboflavin biosynthesis-like protein [Jatrophihabitans sp.]
MRALLPSPLADVDVHEHYAAGWIDRGGLRVNMVSSLDGAGTVDGLSAGLQTRGDNAVFAALRDLADVVLVGARTAEGESYKPARPSGERLAARRRHGLGDALPVALVSRSLRVDPSGPLFGDASTLLFTCAAASPPSRLGQAEVVVCGDDDLDPALMREALRERGLTRVLCEGGPSLFASLTAAGQVDELCLSLTPILAGPGATRIVGGAPWQVARGGLQLTGLLEEEDALFLRLTA